MELPERLVIFDCDGVLVDSEPLSVRVDVEMLAEVGLAISESEIIERFMGRAPELMDDAIAEHLGHRPDAGWSDRWRDIRRTVFAEELTPIEGVLDALDAIALPTCVASSSEPDSLRFKLGVCDLLDRFEGRIFSASEVEHGKPAPDLFLFAASALGAAPERCVVVEDSRYGVEAGRAAGMEVLAFAGGGMTPVAQLEGPGTTVFHDMRELPGLLAGLPDGRQSSRS